MGKIKVGIITLSASDNCGSLLQTYALQEYLKKSCDAEVTILNLVTDASDKLYEISPLKYLRHPSLFRFYLKNYKKNKRQKEDYQEFREKYLNLTLKIYRNVEDLKNLDEEYGFDVIIAGSDQIWNINMLDFSDCFYLPVSTGARKVAYAASMGSMLEFPESKKEWAINCVKDFYRVSVREKSASKTLGNSGFMDVPVVCDPTMLHDHDFWLETAGDRMVKTKYIFYYSWAYSDDDMNKIVADFAKEKNLPVYVINPTKWRFCNPKDYDFVLNEMSGPSAFLNLMAYAEYAFVQSFHGCVFASLFKKNFFFLNERESGIDFRSGGLLELIGAKDRIVHSYEDMREAERADTEYSNSEVNALIEKSKNYLIEACTI